MAVCFPKQVKKEALDKALTPERVAGIWRYAKANYLDKGVLYEDAMTHMAADLNMPREYIAAALTKPKSIRAITNEMFAKQEARRQAIAQAKIEVATIDTPGAMKMLVNLTSIPRRVTTFGHGPVFMVTHGLDLVKSEFKHYLKGAADSWKFASKAQHGAAMDWLRNHDLYTNAQRAGLVVNPEQGPQGILIGGIKHTSWARRAWDALKVTRMRLYEERMNAVPEAERTPEMGKRLAAQINHSTGVLSPGEWGTGAGFGKVSKGMFAPQLTAAKIAKTIVDPIQTAKTFGKMATGQKVSFAERHQAILRTRKAAKYLGISAGLLAVNQAFLEWSGSKEKINFTDPSKSDWLRPKVGGHTINERGSTELIRLLGNIVGISASSRKDLHGRSRTESARDAIARYGHYKIAPGVQLLLEAGMREDTFGRPLPWSGEKGTASKPRYDLPEYILSQGPIYLGGATREIFDTMREQGLSTADVTSIIRGLQAHPEILAEGVGVGLGEAVGIGLGKPSKEDKPKSSLNNEMFRRLRSEFSTPP